MCGWVGECVSGWLSVWVYELVCVCGGGYVALFQQ